MPHRTVRLGNAGGYWGDDLSALRRQIEAGPLDYVTLDFLAEITMSILQRQRRQDPALGYAVDFVGQMRDCLPLLAERGVRVITNAGGINPEGLGRRLVALARELGLPLRVGVVDGDDIAGRLDELTAAGEAFANLETGAAFAPVRPRVTSANVYFGAAPVVRALAAGCQVVVTGRVTDTGITLAPFLHEFGWAADDWGRLAAGIVAGHILECGAQASGGNLTDWRDVPRYDRIGYPIVEMEASGEFTVTKHARTGGLVSEKTVKEQLVYEMGDPARYLAPDVVARFDTIRLRAAGRNRVRVSGVRGEPAPPTLKVSLTYDDGWKAVGDLLVCGPDLRAKAAAFAATLWRRLGHRYEERHASLIGDAAAWPPALAGPEPREALLRLGVRDHDRARVEEFGRALPALILSGPPGVAVTGGRPKPAPVVAYWPALLRREHAAARLLVLDTDGGERAEAVPLTGPTAAGAPARRGKAARSPAPAALSVEAALAAAAEAAARAGARGGARAVKAKLRDLAYARSGDKGDTCNIGVLARSPEAYAWLARHLTAKRVKEFFRGRVKGRVTRHELPNLLAFNFLLERALGGGGTVSLLVDPQGKTLAQALLEMPLPAPARLLGRRVVAAPRPARRRR